MTLQTLCFNESRGWQELAERNRVCDARLKGKDDSPLIRQFRAVTGRLDSGYTDFTAICQRVARQIGNGGKGYSGERLVQR